MHTDCRCSFNIYRKCTHCDYVYPFEETDCKICEPEIRLLAQAEVTKEENEKGLKKLYKRYKNGDVGELEYRAAKSLHENEIISCQEQATTIRERRK